MPTYTSIRDVTSIISALAECAVACRKLTDPSNGVLLFSYPPRFIRLLNDCAATCDIAITLIERKSSMIGNFMEICEEISLECARECSNYTNEEFRDCTSACDLVAKLSLSYILENNHSEDRA